MKNIEDLTETELRSLKPKISELNKTWGFLFNLVMELGAVRHEPTVNLMQELQRANHNLEDFNRLFELTDEKIERFKEALNKNPVLNNRTEDEDLKHAVVMQSIIKTLEITHIRKAILALIEVRFAAYIKQLHWGLQRFSQSIILDPNVLRFVSLLDISGNYLRHGHEWQENEKRLTCAVNGGHILDLNKKERQAIDNINRLVAFGLPLSKIFDTQDCSSFLHREIIFGYNSNHRAFLATGEKLLSLKTQIEKIK